MYREFKRTLGFVFWCAVTFGLAGVFCWQFKANRDMRKYGVKFDAVVEKELRGEWVRVSRKRMEWQHNYQVFFGGKYRADIGSFTKIPEGSKVYVILDSRKIKTIRFATEVETPGMPWQVDDYAWRLLLVAFFGLVTWGFTLPDDDEQLGHVSARMGRAFANFG